MFINTTTEMRTLRNMIQRGLRRSSISQQRVTVVTTPRVRGWRSAYCAGWVCRAGFRNLLRRLLTEVARQQQVCLWFLDVGVRRPIACMQATGGCKAEMQLQSQAPRQWLMLAGLHDRSFLVASFTNEVSVVFEAAYGTETQQCSVEALRGLPRGYGCPVEAMQRWRRQLETDGTGTQPITTGLRASPTRSLFGFPGAR